MSHNQPHDIFEQHFATCDRKMILNSIFIGLLFIPLMVVQTKIIINEIPTITPAILIGSVYIIATFLMLLVCKFKKKVFSKFI